MENIKKNIYIKLNGLIDSELEKENPDAELIGECVDGILRLMPESAYQLTAERRENNILRILNEKTDRRFRSKFVRILLVAAIIAALLLGSVFAYTIIEYKIHDYDTYSIVWANILPKWIDEPIVVSYIPEGFELVDSFDGKTVSAVDYENSEGVGISISKIKDKKIEINTEYVKPEKIVIGEIEYIVFGEEEHGKGVVWFTDDYVFSISASLSDEELLKIAQSVR